VKTVDVDRLQAVVLKHQTRVDHFRRRGGWGWSCSCETDGERFYPTPDPAYVDAARHIAEQLNRLGLMTAGWSGYA
jgi:hypothetical protein